MPNQACSTTQRWRSHLEPLPELMADQPVPWLIEAGYVHVIFNTVPVLGAVPEYEKLLGAARPLGTVAGRAKPALSRAAIGQLASCQIFAACTQP